MTSPAGAAPNQGTPAQGTPAQDAAAQETPAPGVPAPGAPATGPPTFWDAAQIRRVSHQVADLVADYLTLLPDGPAYQPPPRGLVEAMRASAPAEQTADPNQCRPSRRLIAWTARPKSVPNGLSWTT